MVVDDREVTEWAVSLEGDSYSLKLVALFFDLEYCRLVEIELIDVGGALQLAGT